MSEHSTPEERTEKPTQKRMGQLRKDGSLHMSTEVVQVLSILSGILSMMFVAEMMINDMKHYIAYTFKSIETMDAFTRRTAYDLFVEAFRLFAPDVAIVSVIVAVTASLAVFLQTNWNIKEKKIDFRFNMIQPLTGLKRIFEPKNFIKTFSSILKLCIILPMGYSALKHFAPEMVMLMHLTVEEALTFVADAIMYIFWKILYILIAFAIFDYFYTRYQWFKQNKMTKQEVKDERKAQEGDEKTKRLIQSKGLQRIMDRIQASVPQADVVITNPTHYAIALKYDRETMTAPIVVAKGKGFLALRIRKIAKEASVPILERKLLARALYASTEVGTEVPREMFRAIAQVLAYVYKLKNPHAQHASATT